jgi:hypothetical protein
MSAEAGKASLAPVQDDAGRLEYLEMEVARLKEENDALTADLAAHKALDWPRARPRQAEKTARAR